MIGEATVFSYDPAIFNVDSIDRAKAIILTDDGVHTLEERWVVETEYVLDLLERFVPSRAVACLDYGCGIGRLAKPLIERWNWAVIGADISSSMRGFAVNYVNSPRFVACDPKALDQLSLFGVRFDVAIAVWSLQHVCYPNEDLARIERLLRPGGTLFVLNTQQRFVPTNTAPWVNDQVDIWSLLAERFMLLSVEPVDPAIVPSPPAFWGVYERKEAPPCVDTSQPSSPACGSLA